MEFPPFTGTSRSGERVYYPADFSGAPTLALVAFDLGQREQLETWLPFAERVTRDGTVRGRVLALLSSGMAMMRGMVLKALRAVATSPAADESIVLVLTDVDAFCAALGIADQRTVHAFAVAPDGRVLAHASGPFDTQAGTMLEARLRESA